MALKIFFILSAWLCIQFFSPITDSLGSVFADYQLTLLTSFFFKTCIGKLLFNHTNEFQTMLTSFPEKKNNKVCFKKKRLHICTVYNSKCVTIFLKQTLSLESMRHYLVISLLPQKELTPVCPFLEYTSFTYSKVLNIRAGRPKDYSYKRPCSLIRYFRILISDQEGT